MAVPKIAVIALVAIMATPILLGYALNLTETTVTDYRTNNDSVNVTPLLLNGGEMYSYAHGDVYQLNTKFKQIRDILPVYENVTSSYSSLNMDKIEWATGTHGIVNNKFSQFSYFYYQNDATNTDGMLNMELWNGTTLELTIQRLHTAYYDTNHWLHYTYYTNVGDFSNLSAGALEIYDTNWLVYFRDNGNYQGTATLEYSFSNNITDTYADFSAGYHFTGYPNRWEISLPSYTKSALLTIDLDSITDPNYSIRLGNISYVDLEKTTDGLGNVTWKAINPNDPYNQTFELYYNPSGNNTYQVKINLEFLGTSSTDPTKNEYSHTFDFRYVGKWPVLIGEANYYNEYELSNLVKISKNIDETMNYIVLYNTNFTSIDRSPTIRMDDALFRAYVYDVIEDQTYSPSSFKTNPSTKLTNVHTFGRSIEFGGNTYTVSDDGKITVGSHQIPVNNLVLSSTYTSPGGYDNKIGNTVVSHTILPSTIKFNGQWSASVETTSQEQYTYTKTEWNAGSFAWDGIDHNFLIVGLITCLGVFVALGIYARKSRSGGIIPLMIVTGCAAALFFIML